MILEESDTRGKMILSGEGSDDTKVRELIL